MEQFYEVWFNAFSYWHWFGIAITLMILDMLLGAQFFLVWMGGSAALVGTMAFFFPSIIWQYQLVIFSVVSVLSLWFWWHLLKSKSHATDKPYLNQRANQYLGRTFTLEEPIVNGRGRIKVDDSMWRIEGDDLPIGAKVVVVSADGVVLKVKAE